MKILIVDDEFYSRENVKGMLSGKARGDLHIMESDDGLNALKVCEGGFVPDILLTDVRMPRMDGIALAFKVRALYPHCAIVFMSGHSDKEYLKSAILVNAVGYVEKPFTPDELDNAVGLAAARVEENRYRSQLADVVGLLRMQAGTELLSRQPDFPSIAAKLERAGTKLPLSGSFVVVAVECPHATAAFQQYHQQCPLENALPAIKHGLYLYILFTAGRVLTGEAITAFCSNLREFGHAEGLPMGIGVGRVKNRVQTLRESYLDATVALEHAFFSPERGIHLYPATQPEVYAFTEGEVGLFADLVRSREYGLAAARLKELTAGVRRCPGTSRTAVREQYFHLYNAIIGIAKAMYPGEFVDREEIAGGWKAIQAAASVDELCEYVGGVLAAFHTFAQSRAGALSYAERAAQLVQENYGDDTLSLDRIAQLVNISPPYLSSVFRQEQGVTLSQYINDVRMRRACELLQSPGVRVADVAGLCGYNDRTYFARVFKKFTGCTPSEYSKSGGGRA